MNRATVPPPHQPTVVSALTRPTSTANRLRGRLGRLRLAWRRVAIATGAGLLAAGLTTAWLEAASHTSERRAPPRAAADDSLTAADTVGSGPPPVLADDQRVLALDRSTIALPVTVGNVVEVIGLRPSVADVQVEVVAARAEVVGVTEQAILLAVDAEAAYEAAEIAAVGRVTILGREQPTG